MARVVDCANDRCPCAHDGNHHGEPVESQTYGAICCRQCYKNRKERQYRTVHAEAIAASKKAKYPNRFRDSRAKYEMNHPHAAQDRQMRRLYGVTPAKYESMVMTQCGTCAVCGEAETRVLNGKPSRLPVHHDHTTGRVIALVCHRCNAGMGMLADSPELLQRAAALQTEGDTWLGS